MVSALLIIAICEINFGRLRKMDAEIRSKNMRNIRAQDTSIELMLRKRLWHEGIRYRKNYSCLPGKPDVAITKYKIAIFCDGEFFHGKDWEQLKVRLSNGKNSNYWVKKIERNITRDKHNDQILKYYDWIVLHFWESDIRNNIDKCVQTIKETILEQTIRTFNENE